MTDREHSLKTYISDMLALEQHVRVPFETQIRDDDFSSYSGAKGLLARLSDLSNAHIASLEGCLAQYGGHEAQPIKGAVSSTAGFFAGAIDKLRKTGAAKALRDDYAALSLCVVSYGMLLTAAEAYGAPEVSRMAQQHMQNYAEIVVELGLLMPEIVVGDLASIGLTVDPQAARTSREMIQSVWRTSGTGRSTTGEISTETATGRTLRSV